MSARVFSWGVFGAATAILTKGANARGLLMQTHRVTGLEALNQHGSFE